MFSRYCNTKELIDYIEVKKLYKRDLFNKFVQLLDDCRNSKELHQEIAYYLGMDKHLLNKIYHTRKGDLVRSKSEVIISNLLYDFGVDYQYENKFFYKEGKWIEPDFTIFTENGEIYWEHLGMIGRESYDENWLRKLEIYDTYFPDKLITT